MLICAVSEQLLLLCAKSDTNAQLLRRYRRSHAKRPPAFRPKRTTALHGRL